MSDTALPSYPVPRREPRDTHADEAPAGKVVGPNPPQSSHGAAGGIDAHRGPDGGMGMGHKAPQGWPEGHQR
jgi:hypothetical protein